MTMAAESTATASAAPARSRPRGRGNALGFWFFRTALRFTGLRGAYGLLYFVAPYYALFDRAAIAAAGAYLRHLFPRQNGLARRMAICRLFICQGKCLIDRGAHNAGAVEFRFDTAQVEQAGAELARSPAGFILLLSHFGGWQLALPHLRNLTASRPVSLLMNAAETPDVQAHVRGDDAGFHVISPDAGPACVVEMVARLQRGEIVSVMGDRAYGGQTAAVPFLGATAYFPASAFAVARAAQCPVLALFAVKTGDQTYALETKTFPPPARDDRQSIRKGMADYAATLETYVRRHPFQGFLFDDVWRSPEADEAANEALRRRTNGV